MLWLVGSLRRPPPGRVADLEVIDINLTYVCSGFEVPQVDVDQASQVSNDQLGLQPPTGSVGWNQSRGVTLTGTPPLGW
ncbi:hypothetical protein GCM10023321_63110 [Pseudonocardia eucalypti]|uniref:Uncharacterized protein n=1 Tax=Pseudonocardia eucalypti TaxID=648755 RepID=A0ABP9QWN7_9PSEU